MNDGKMNSRLNIFGTLPGFVGIALVIFLCCINPPSGWTKVEEDHVAADKDLFEMSIEDLMNLKVTSVGKKAQKLSEAAAAVFVITSEDIRRSGATCIAEILRMVPGLQVARIDAHVWAVTSRGFNGYFSNKLLVLVDGRTVYTPLSSGVFWDVQDLPLQDVERIEVIRGPGATLWGANAVNGVINILTKTSKDTQGTLMEAGLGTEEKGFGTIRYGGKLSDQTTYRLYAKYFDRDAAVFASGDKSHDQWRVLRSGFRMDYEPETANSITVQGDIYDGSVGGTISTSAPQPFYSQTYNSDVDIFGGNILGKWKHTIDNTSDFSIQAYYDRTERQDRVTNEMRNTFDIDFQHRFAPTNGHEVIWGLGYRYTQDDINNSFTVNFNPSSKGDDLFSGFLQDEISLCENLLRLTLGSKFEHNDYTGFEVQPNLRLLYKLTGHQSIWASVSRSVRTPSRAEGDPTTVNQMILPPNTIAPGSPVTYIQAKGSHDFTSEKLLAFELGYRALATDTLSIDLATFYNLYDDLFTVEPHFPYFELLPLPHLAIPFVADNKMSGRSYGLEMALDWRYSNYFSLKASYTYFRMRLALDNGSLYPVADSAEEDSPSHQISLRPSINIGKDWELDFWTRYVSSIPNQDIKSYVSLDIRIAWKALENLELSLVGQSLLDPHRPEFDQDEYLNVQNTELQRSVYGKITWQF